MLSLHKGLWGMLALSLMLPVIACNPLKPGKAKPDSSNVSVAFDPTALGDLADAMKTLQVRVHKVENDQTGAAEGEAQRFTIEMQRQSYTIKGVTLGMKDIEVAILDDQDLALGTGKVRVLVKPGKNTTEPLKIKLTQVSQPVTSVPVELKIGGNGAALVKNVKFWWKSAATGTEGTTELAAQVLESNAVSYQSLKPLLEAQCVSCHKEGQASAKLKLDRFPFVSTYIPDQAELLATVMARIQDTEAPMPPSDEGELMEDAAITKFKDWQAGGFLADAPAAGEVLFKGLLADQKVADLLQCNVTLTGVDGIELLKKDLADFTVPQTSTMNMAIDLQVEDPSVDIPIIVEP